MKLYEIAAQYDVLRSMEDVPPEVLADTLESIDGEFDEKVEAIACVIKEMTAESETLKKEASTLQERSKAKENEAKRLKEYLFHQMQIAGREKVEALRAVVRISKKAPTLVIDDEDALIAWATLNHEEYIRQRAPEVNRTAVREAIDRGENIPGARLESGVRLAVK